MIIVDLETSGLDFEKAGIWQIGAIEFENPDNQFLEEARIDNEDYIDPVALKICGKTEDYLRDKNKQSQKQLIGNFLNWINNINMKNFVCENPQYDMGWLLKKISKYNLQINFPHRAYDLHSIASTRYYQVYGKFLLKNNKSDMGLTNTLKFCGIKDERITYNGKELVEGKPHDALEDCKLEGECLSRLIYGKNLFSEYNKFPIPDYLKKAG